MFFRAVDPHKLQIPSAEEALPGRGGRPFQVSAQHAVLDAPLEGPFETRHEFAMFGLGCFWGAERKFWQTEGVVSTAVGYAGGHTPNPTYAEVCSGRTGHNEVVRVVFDPQRVSYEALVRVFFESHNPTQGMRQGNDQGTQYRSGIYTYSDMQKKTAAAARETYGQELGAAGHGAITTEVCEAPPFYFAEDEHQQYLYKNPAGYCGLGGTGVACPIGLMSR
jgi:peptide-methionine (S)-S-oxide reductase